MVDLSNRETPDAFQRFLMFFEKDGHLINHWQKVTAALLFDEVSYFLNTPKTGKTELFRKLEAFFNSEDAKSRPEVVVQKNLLSYQTDAPSAPPPVGLKVEPLPVPQTPDVPKSSSPQKENPLLAKKLAERKQEEEEDRKERAAEVKREDREASKR